MRTNLHDILGADPILSEEGIWVDICQGVRVKLASSESRRYKQALRLAMLKRVDQRTATGLPQEVLVEVLAEAMAKGLLLDWQGVTDDQGKPLPFSAKAAGDLLGDPELNIFSDRIAAAAQNLAAFRNQQIGTAEKN